MRRPDGALRHPRRIPSFSLYGEPIRDRPQTDFLHIEDIQSRSRKYMWKIAMHRHAGLCQCLLVRQGPAHVSLDAAQSDLDAPALIVIPAGTVHGFGFRADTQGYVLTVDLERLLTVAPAAQRAPIETLFTAARAANLGAESPLARRVAPLFERLLQEFREPDSLHTPVGGWLACSALWLIAAASAEETPAEFALGLGRERLRRFRLLVEQRFLQHWSVARYARALGISESSLNRLCRGSGRATAFDWIQQRLALEARRRLIYVAGSVGAIGAELGFADPAYFCRFFRRHHGVSPSAFRRGLGPGTDG